MGMKIKFKASSQPAFVNNSNKKLVTDDDLKNLVTNIENDWNTYKRKSENANLGTAQIFTNFREANKQKYGSLLTHVNASSEGPEISNETDEKAFLQAVSDRTGYEISGTIGNGTISIKPTTENVPLNSELFQKPTTNTNITEENNKKEDEDKKKKEKEEEKNTISMKTSPNSNPPSKMTVKNDKKLPEEPILFDVRKSPFIVKSGIGGTTSYYKGVNVAGDETGNIVQIKGGVKNATLKTSIEATIKKLNEEILKNNPKAKDKYVHEVVENKDPETGHVNGVLYLISMEVNGVKCCLSTDQFKNFIARTSLEYKNQRKNAPNGGNVTFKDGTSSLSKDSLPKQILNEIKKDPSYKEEQEQEKKRGEEAKIKEKQKSTELQEIKNKDTPRDTLKF